ncbi:MAG: CoB--CoM heterodisulfide reductase subunit B [Candidatus Lokiarchaeota archaeon]|nr:CoB--CoM heterodisulfide reductase subunit B [Candidatus Harpocratesius repetitus]
MVKENTFSFFLGCIMPNRYPQIESATRFVMKKLGFTLMEMERATCCPAPGVFRSFDKSDWMVAAARNIAIAEKNDADILTVCNGCFGTLIDVNKHLKSDPEMAAKVNEKLKEMGDYQWKGTIRVRHIAEILGFEVGPTEIQKYIVRKAEARAAVHYGCHLLKPSRIRQLASPEIPTFLEEYVEALGVKSVDFAQKLTCCGAGGGVLSFDKNTSMKILKEKLGHMQAANPDFIFDTCPFCQLQFDGGQTTVNEIYGTNFDIPVIHMSQLTAWCMGMDMEKIGLQYQAHGKDYQFKELKEPMEKVSIKEKSIEGAG